MKRVKQYLPYILIVIAAIYIICMHYYRINPHDIIAITGATPKAITAPIPEGITLIINGCTPKAYEFNSDTLKAFVPTCLFTREINETKTYEGAYRYHGIPIINILDGIKIKKSADSAFDGPHDIIVQFKSRNGKISSCSYGELVMSGNMFNYILAYKREPIQPSKEGDTYKKNMHKENIKGLRLVIASDADTSRYLDDVVEINLTEPNINSLALPKTEKGKQCTSNQIVCISHDARHLATFSNTKEQTVSQWVQVGHGRGYKGIVQADGYNLKSFLYNNFWHIPRNAWFMFVGCDGYRCIFSYREIFEQDTGDKLMIATQINKKPAPGNLMVASTGDFFVDRCVWGLSHIILFIQD